MKNDVELTSKVLAIYDDVTDFCHYVLMSKTGNPVRAYLFARGITEMTLKRYKIGYAPGGSRIYKYLKKRGYEDDDIHDSRICDVTRARSKDFFRQYIIFPIIYKSRTVSFTARWPTNNPPPRAPKHKHLRGSLKYFYNMNALHEDNIFVVEGPIDTLTLLQEKFHAIGTLGIGRINNRNADYFTGDKNIIIAFDYDPNQSGILGALRSAVILFEYANQDPYILEFPHSNTKMDINSFFRKYNEDKFYQLIQNAKRFSQRPDGRSLIKELEESKSKILRRDHLKDFKDMDFQHLYYECRDYPLEELVNIYTDMNPASSGQLKGTCPLPGHEDTNPSFYIYQEENMFKCYGCSSFGDSIQFIQLMEDLSFKQAISFINENYLQTEHKKIDNEIHNQLLEKGADA